MASPAYYRADIDVLRGIAILGVLGFHFFPEWLPGGFVGVDVFFVISGFLITTILQRELRDHRFRLSSFYERRCRRILPALAAVLYGVVVGFLWLASPHRLLWMGENLVAAGLLSSNIYLWLKQSNYFAPDAEHNPLLHAWSLSLEEQFYVLFPLLLLAVMPMTILGRWAVLWMLAAGSLAASLLVTWSHPLSTFYLLPFRAWELGFGVLLAVYLSDRPAAPRRQRRGLLRVLGAVTVVATMVSPGSMLYLHQTQVVLACLGTVLLIYAGDGLAGTPVPAILLPLQAIGRISYSLYLWHWPLLAAANHAERIGAAAIGKSSVLTASFVLAWASYRWVEQPARDRKRMPSRRFWYLLGFAYLPLVALTVVIFITDGLPQRFLANHQRWLAHEFFDRSKYQHDQCYLLGRNRFDDFETEGCLHIDPLRPNVLLFGDSHAAQYWPGLVAAYPEIHFLQANASGCRPLLDAPGDEPCQRLRRWVFEQFLPTHGKQLDALVLAGRWHARHLPALSATLKTLARHVDDVIVIGPMIEYALDVPTLLVRSQLHDASDLARHHRREDRFDLDEQMRPVVSEAGGLYVSVLDVLCPGRRCRLLTRSGEPLHYDYGHLSVPGSLELVEDLTLPLARRAGTR